MSVERRILQEQCSGLLEQICWPLRQDREAAILVPCVDVTYGTLPLMRPSHTTMWRAMISVVAPHQRRWRRPRMSTTASREQKTHTTYERYLNTSELFQLQKPPEEQIHPDELTFQVVHQTFELWWKVTLQQFGAAIELLNADKIQAAAAPLHRAVNAQAVVTQ